MGLRKPEEYIQALREKSKKAQIYVLGERVEDVTKHPFTMPAVKAFEWTYKAPWDDFFYDEEMGTHLARAYSPFINEEVNRFNHIHQSPKDLAIKVKYFRKLSHKAGSCFQRCVGWDAINTMSIITYDIDKWYEQKGEKPDHFENFGTYYERFLKFLKYVQKNDIALAGVMTDAKGVRSLRPHEQPNKDVYVHVKEVTDEGIIVRGAKANITGVIASEEMIVMPTRAMTEKDKDFAIAFAVPIDAEGVTLVVGRYTNDTRRLEDPNVDALPNVFPAEAIVIFDDVFVPWERVFMFREYQFAAELVEIFSSYHRQAYGGCKPGLADVIIGGAYHLAKEMGIVNKCHIREKLTEMVFLAEAMHAGGLAAAWEGKKAASGTYYVDQMMANVTKQMVTRFPYEIARLAHDIAGGIIGTLPSYKDFIHEKIGKYLQEYLKCLPDYPAEWRFRVLRLLENLTLSVEFLIESVHGAGSPEAQRIWMRRFYPFEEMEDHALRLAGINPEEKPERKKQKQEKQ